MNFPVLPFCRTNISNFKFQIGTELEDSSDLIIFETNGYRIRLTDNLKNDEFLIFGKFENKLCLIVESLEMGKDFHHLMGKNFEENIRTIAGIGISVLKWHKQTIFCGTCGGNLKFSEKELNAKVCEKCKTVYFPRINPAIIIAVKRKDSILVTRKSEWKSGRYGLIAGFIEYGENIEEAAIREVMEETGVKIKNIKYVASQFWPFPFQLMIGLEADFLEGEIKVDKNELEEAKWLKFSEINEEILPPPSSIARFLMEKFIAK